MNVKLLLAFALGEGNVNIAEALLLNVGASVLTVQALLGHKHVDTTLRYTRVYDRTVAADYERAAGDIEGEIATNRQVPPPSEKE